MAKGLIRPIGSAKLNPASPQANGLAFWATSNRLGMQNVLQREYATPSGNAGVRPLGQYGMAATFDGTGDGYSCGANVPYIGTPFTVTAWVRPGFSDTTSARHMVVNRSSGGYTRFGYNIQWLGDLNQWRCDCTPSGDIAMADSETPVTAGDVHLVGFSVPEGTIGQGYWDGVPKNTIGGAMTDPTPTIGDLFYVGTSGFGGGDDRGFIGDIWDVRVYHRALSVSEWWQLYDPRTRWDLYWTPSPTRYLFVGGAAAPASTYRRLTLLGAGV